MPAPITATEAAARYDTDRVPGSWYADSLPGIGLASQAELEEVLAYAIELERRRHHGLRADADRAAPHWVLDALPDCVYAAETLKQPSGLLSVLIEPLGLLGIIDVCRTGSIAAWYRLQDEATRTSLESHASKVLGRAPAQLTALQDFYLGTRLHFHLLGRGEPMPGDVRLLAAARGLEPITGGLDRARKLWEDRIRTWRHQVDPTSLLAHAK